MNNLTAKRQARGMKIVESKQFSAFIKLPRKRLTDLKPLKSFDPKLYRTCSLPCNPIQKHGVRLSLQAAMKWFQADAFCTTFRRANFSAVYVRWWLRAMPEIAFSLQDDITIGSHDYERRPNSRMLQENEPSSVMFVDRTRNEFNRLPKSQNPTVTLLQKARGTAYHDPCSSKCKISTFLVENTSQKVPSSNSNFSGSQEVIPGTGNNDQGWIRYPFKGNGEVIRHTIHREPIKFEGIGPTDEKGLPIGLRSVGTSKVVRKK